MSFPLFPDLSTNGTSNSALSVGDFGDQLEAPDNPKGFYGTDLCADPSFHNTYSPASPPLPLPDFIGNGYSHSGPNSSTSSLGSRQSVSGTSSPFEMKRLQQENVLLRTQNNKTQEALKSLHHQLQILKIENQTLRTNYDKLTDSLKGGPITASTSARHDMVRLQINKFQKIHLPHVRFFHLIEWETWSKENLPTPRTGRDKTLFLEYENGEPLSDQDLEAIKAFQRHVFHDIKNAGLATRVWGDLGSEALCMHSNKMRERYPILDFCSNDWKVIEFGSQEWMGFNRNHLSKKKGFVLSGGLMKPKVIDVDEITDDSEDNVSYSTQDQGKATTQSNKYGGSKLKREFTPTTPEKKKVGNAKRVRRGQSTSPNQSPPKLLTQVNATGHFVPLTHVSTETAMAQPTIPGLITAPSQAGPSTSSAILPDRPTDKIPLTDASFHIADPFIACKPLFADNSSPNVAATPNPASSNPTVVATPDPAASNPVVVVSPVTNSSLVAIPPAPSGPIADAPSASVPSLKPASGAGLKPSPTSTSEPLATPALELPSLCGTVSHLEVNGGASPKPLPLPTVSLTQAGQVNHSRMSGDELAPNGSNTSAPTSIPTPAELIEPGNDSPPVAALAPIKAQKTSTGIYKPTKSGTDRNRCGQQWVQWRKNNGLAPGTSAEFGAYWSSLTSEQQTLWKEPGHVDTFEDLHHLLNVAN